MIFFPAREVRARPSQVRGRQGWGFVLMHVGDCSPATENATWLMCRRPIRNVPENTPEVKQPQEPLCKGNKGDLEMGSRSPELEAGRSNRPGAPSFSKAYPGPLRFMVA